MLMEISDDGRLRVDYSESESATVGAAWLCYYADADAADADYGG